MIVHNGRIQNDDELIASYQRNRAHPNMTVDSEAIAAALHVNGVDRVIGNDGYLSTQQGLGTALHDLVGSYAFAAMHEEDPTSIILARGLARPLYLYSSIAHDWTIAISTPEAAAFLKEHMQLDGVLTECPTGWWGVLQNGSVHEQGRFHVTSFEEEPSYDYDYAQTETMRNYIVDLITSKFTKP